MNRYTVEPALPGRMGRGGFNWTLAERARVAEITRKLRIIGSRNKATDEQFLGGVQLAQVRVLEAYLDTWDSTHCGQCGAAASESVPLLVCSIDSVSRCHSCITIRFRTEFSR